MFQLVLLLLLIGAALVLVGLVGAGLEVREVQVPKISGAMRILAIVFGIGFVASGAFLGYQQIILDNEAKKLKAKIEESFGENVKQTKEKAKKIGQEMLENTAERVQRLTEGLSTTDKPDFSAS